MFVRWNGKLAYKAYYDPERDHLDIVSSDIGGDGQMVMIGEGEPDVGFLCEPDGFCGLIELERACAGSSEELSWTRPEDCREANDAEVEIVADSRACWRFDPADGTLRVHFEGIEPVLWARVGANLLWLAIDDDARLAAFVFEGVSRDPGGKAQSAWLSEMDAG